MAIKTRYHVKNVAHISSKANDLKLTQNIRNKSISLTCTFNITWTVEKLEDLVKVMIVCTVAKQSSFSYEAIV